MQASLLVWRRSWAVGAFAGRACSLWQGCAQEAAAALESRQLTAERLSVWCAAEGSQTLPEQFADGLSELDTMKIAPRQHGASARECSLASLVEWHRSSQQIQAHSCGLAKFGPCLQQCGFTCSMSSLQQRRHFAQRRGPKQDPEVQHLKPVSSYRLS